MKKYIPYSLFTIIGSLLSFIVVTTVMNKRMDELVQESLHMASGAYYRGCVDLKSPNANCKARSDDFRLEVAEMYEDYQIIEEYGNEKGQKMIQERNAKKIKKEVNSNQKLGDDFLEQKTNLSI